MRQQPCGGNWIVPQEGFLFSGSARDIALGDRRRRWRRSRRRLQRSERPSRRRAAGGDRDRGRRARHPALGRPASAGCLRPGAAGRAADPDLDEATSNVDVRTEKTSRRASSGCWPDGPRSSSPTASRRSAAPARSLVEHGRIAEAGTHQELIEAGGPYSRLYGAWAESSAARRGRRRRNCRRRSRRRFRHHLPYRRRCCRRRRFRALVLELLQPALLLRLRGFRPGFLLRPKERIRTPIQPGQLERSVLRCSLRTHKFPMPPGVFQCRAALVAASPIAALSSRSTASSRRSSCGQFIGRRAPFEKPLASEGVPKPSRLWTMPT